MTGQYVSRTTLQGWAKIIDDLKKENANLKTRVDALEEENKKLKAIIW